MRNKAARETRGIRSAEIGERGARVTLLQTRWGGRNVRAFSGHGSSVWLNGMGVLLLGALGCDQPTFKPFGESTNVSEGKTDGGMPGRDAAAEDARLLPVLGTGGSGAVPPEGGKAGGVGQVGTGGVASHTGGASTASTGGDRAPNGGAMTASGGARVATGGAMATGGSPSMGGAPATGGATASTGGAAGAGGLLATGGRPATGGAPTYTGGASGTGGLPSTGGTSATGGTLAMPDAGADSSGDDEPGHCEDGKKNGKETDVDCGGPCGPCSAKQSCKQPLDCVLLLCIDGTCVL